MAVRNPTPIGEKFNRLTIESDIPRVKGEAKKVVARCICGKVKELRLILILRGDIKSCGCLKRDTKPVFNVVPVTRHGHSKNGVVSKAYSTWCNMLTRCTNKNNDHWLDYGGRGIKVCERWLNSFENFLSDMGEPLKGMTLDRKDSNGNYDPLNCKWSTWMEQANNKRNNHFIELNGVKLTVAQWSRKTGIGCNIIYARINKYGWDSERALTTAPREWGPGKPRKL